jgi:hypothetical protein
MGGPVASGRILGEQRSFGWLPPLLAFSSTVAVVLMASAPWVPLQPDQQTRTEMNRWFLTVAGSVDAIAACVLLALALRPRRTLLIAEPAVAAIVAGAIILPFQPTFAAILAIGGGAADRLSVMRDVRMSHMPRLAVSCRPNGPALG